MRDASGGKNDGGAFDLRIRFDKAAVIGVDDFKPIERLAIAILEAAGDVIEGQAKFVSVDSHGLEGWTGINHIRLAVGLGQGPEGKAASDLLFIRGMEYR
jgi:hypothetical protein